MPGKSTPDQVRLNVIIKREDDGVENWNKEIGETQDHINPDEVSTEPARERLHTSSSVPAREI